jgi:hypothetical protein
MMMWDRSDCRRAASAFLRSVFQKEHHCATKGSGDAVHEYIEAATRAFHSLEEGLYLFLHGVIDAKCDGGAAGRADHFGCLFNRFRTIVRGGIGTHASSSAIDHRTSFSERSSDAATCAACRAGNDSDGAGK